MRLALSSVLAGLLILSGCARNEAPSTPLVPARAGVGLGDPMMVFMVPPNPDPIVDEWVIALEDNTDPADIANELDLTLIRYSPSTGLGLYAGSFPEGGFEDVTGIREHQANGTTVWSYPVELSLDFVQGEWSFEEVEGQAALAPLNLTTLHGATQGEGALVAVLDTGADITHSHLKNRVQVLPSGLALGSLETPNGIDDDGNGVIDDGYGHGTHVAGTVLSVAPEARVLPIRVMNEEGWGTVFDLATGLTLARIYGADVVNLSLILAQESPVIEYLLQNLASAGIVVVSAAGNTPGIVGYPASSAYALAVSAYDETLNLAAFSGGWSSMLAAPGVSVASCFPENRIAWGTGTSMATGVTSGCVAATLGFHAAQPGSWAASALCATALPLDPLGAVSHGRVRPLKAVWANGKDQVSGPR